MHRSYLKEAHRCFYQQLVLNGSLREHLADANEKASEMLDRLIKQMAKHEGVTERLKAERPMLWAGRMNNIQDRAEEIITNESINAL